MIGRMFLWHVLLLGLERFALTLHVASPPLAVSVGEGPVSARKQVDRNRKILIMQGERQDGHLQYMYEPPMTTLRIGFETITPQWEVVMPAPNSSDAAMKTQLEQLKRGDLMIWLGCEGVGTFHDAIRTSQTVPGRREMSDANSASEARLLFDSDYRLFNFASLRSRGVRLVYYQTEPTHSCVMTADHVDEMWDFSWHNIENCRRQHDAPIQRYVPLGALPTITTRQNPEPGPLLFFGMAKARPCYLLLKAMMRGKLERVYDAWNDETYAKVLEEHNIYLNIHKGCKGFTSRQDADNPITWRNWKLLNAHGLIISQRAFPSDESEFEGMIDFVPFAEIPKKYEEIASLNQTSRQQLADERAALFQKKFQPAKILERAGIPNLLNSLWLDGLNH